jgi:hypothetical protein
MEAEQQSVSTEEAGKRWILKWRRRRARVDAVHDSSVLEREDQNDAQISGEFMAASLEFSPPH